MFDALSSPESLTSTRAFDYAEHKIVQDRPRLQWLADALETISLDLMLHVGFTNPQTQIAALAAAARDHQARALVFGNGIHRGYFILTSLAETHHHSADDGSLIWITARIELKEWVAGAEIDASAAPRPKTPPPAIVPADPIVATAAPFDRNQPIGPHNLLPTAAILTLGAVPANTYTPPGYPNAGVSAGVSNGTTSVPVTTNYTSVPATVAVRAAP